jgi:hypothetical protein
MMRLDSGEWGDTANPFTMNARAQSLNLGAARFIAYRPEAFQRTFDPCDPQAIAKSGASARATHSVLCKGDHAVKDRGR